jgi:hypothetical protein
MMTDLNYKKYSLENLENWLYDAMSCGDATPQEIYDVIVKVVKDEYYTYKKQAADAYELLALLNGNGQSYEDVIKEKEYYEPSMPPWGHSDMEYLVHNSPKTDMVNRWVLPVELDGLTGECYIQLPDDLLERAGLQEGSMVHWIDRGDGSFELRKVTKPLGTDEC